MEAENLVCLNHRINKQLLACCFVAAVLTACGGETTANSVNALQPSAPSSQSFPRVGLIAAAAASDPWNGVDPVDATEQALTLLAEAQYPHFFPGHKATQVFQQYRYRFYPETGCYVGLDQMVKVSGIFVMGCAFGSAPVYMGPLLQWFTPATANAAAKITMADVRVTDYAVAGCFVPDNSSVCNTKVTWSSIAADPSFVISNDRGGQTTVATTSSGSWASTYGLGINYTASINDGATQLASIQFTPSCFPGSTVSNGQCVYQPLILRYAPTALVVWDMGRLFTVAETSMTGALLTRVINSSNLSIDSSNLGSQCNIADRPLDNGAVIVSCLTPIALGSPFVDYAYFQYLPPFNRVTTYSDAVPPDITFSGYTHPTYGISTAPIPPVALSHGLLTVDSYSDPMTLYYTPNAGVKQTLRSSVGGSGALISEIRAYFH